LIVSQWWTKSEQTIRTAIWVSSSGIAQIIGGVAAWRLGSHLHAYELDAWKVTFILFGSLALFIGLMGFFLIPDSQLNAPFLSQDLRNLAVERVRSNQQGIGNKKFKWYQIRECLVDPFVWAIFLFGVACNIPAGGLTNFFSLIIVSFGFEPAEALLYSAPAGAFGIVIIMTWGLVSWKFGCRIFGGIVCLLLVVIGIVMIIALPEEAKTARLIGYYLTMGIPAAEASLASLISTDIAGYTKKTTVCVLFFFGYCGGNIIGPQVFGNDADPDFRTAEIIILCLLVFCIIDFAFMWWLLRGRNNQKAKARSSPSYRKQHGSEFWDLTDMENVEFEYVL